VFAAIASNMVRVFADPCEKRVAAETKTAIAIEIERRGELFIDE
jgi:hypothetical protein